MEGSAAEIQLEKTSLILSRSRSMDRVLEACPQCGEKTDVSDHLPLTELCCPNCSAVFVARRQFDHYQVETVLGRGGMGAVYKALDIQLGRRVALKVLRQELSKEVKFLAQLDAEAKITASINHPSVVRVYARGACHEMYYIAFELIEGGTLDDLMKGKGKLPESDVLRYGIQVASGLGAAYQKGLIHRDVKPGNVLLMSPQTVKVADFGLAMYQTDLDPTATELWGTPQYIAPEKLDGVEDFRSDLYSLGASLFHALAGRPVFTAPDVGSLVAKTQTEKPPGVQTFAPLASNNTAYVLRKMLSKAPADRYQSYAELVEHLEFARDELLQRGGRSTQSNAGQTASGPVQRAQGWRKFVPAFGLVVVGLVIAGVLLWMRSTRPATNVGERPKVAAVKGVPLSATERLFTTVAHRARRQLIEGDAADAHASFAKLGRELTAQPDRSWGILFEGIAAAAAGQMDAARGAFRRVGEEPWVAESAEDQALAKFLNDLSKEFSSSALPDPTRLKKLNPASHEASGILAGAIYHFAIPESSGGEGEALARFFRKETLSAPPWIAEFQPLITRLLVQQATFTEATERYTASADPADKVSAVRELQSLDDLWEHRREAFLKPLAAELEQYERAVSAIPRDGVYKIIEQVSGKALQVLDRSYADGGAVGLGNYEPEGWSQWNVKQVDGGGFQITSGHVGKALTKESDGAKRAIQMEVTDATEQGWKLIATTPGLFKLVAKADEGSLAATDTTAPQKTQHLTHLASGIPGALEWRFVPVYQIDPVAGWNSVRVRADTLPATVDAAAGIWSVKGGGGFFDRADEFHFVYQEVEGDFELTARLNYLRTEDRDKNAGLMCRGSITGDSWHTTVALSGDGLEKRARRVQVIGSSREMIAPHSAPVWLRLRCKSGKLTTSWSGDGKTWKQASVDTLKPSQRKFCVGLVVTAYHEAAVFDNVTLTLENDGSQPGNLTPRSEASNR